MVDATIAGPLAPQSQDAPRYAQLKRNAAQRVDCRSRDPGLTVNPITDLVNR
jgi:hypothetical protein